MFEEYNFEYENYIPALNTFFLYAWIHREFTYYLIPEYLFLIFLSKRLRNVQLSSEQRLNTRSTNPRVLLAHAIIVSSYLINLCVLEDFKSQEEKVSTFFNLLYIVPAISWTASYKLFKLETHRDLPRSNWTHGFLWTTCIIANLMHFIVDCRTEILFQNMLCVTRVLCLVFFKEDMFVKDDLDPFLHDYEAPSYEMSPISNPQSMEDQVSLASYVSKVPLALQNAKSDRFIDSFRGSNFNFKPILAQSTVFEGEYPLHQVDDSPGLRKENFMSKPTVFVPPKTDFPNRNLSKSNTKDILMDTNVVDLIEKLGINEEIVMAQEGFRVFSISVAIDPRISIRYHQNHLAARDGKQVITIILRINNRSYVVTKTLEEIMSLLSGAFHEVTRNTVLQAGNVKMKKLLLYLQSFMASGELPITITELQGIFDKIYCENLSFNENAFKFFNIKPEDQAIVLVKKKFLNYYLREQDEIRNMRISQGGTFTRKKSSHFSLQNPESPCNESSLLDISRFSVDSEKEKRSFTSSETENESFRVLDVFFGEPLQSKEFDTQNNQASLEKRDIFVRYEITREGEESEGVCPLERFGEINDDLEQKTKRTFNQYYFYIQVHQMALRKGVPSESCLALIKEGIESYFTLIRDFLPHDLYKEAIKILTGAKKL